VGFLGGLLTSAGSRALGLLLCFFLTTGGVVSIQEGAEAQQPPGPITYIHDELGRLRAVVDPASDTATYAYDAVGNILSVSRHPSSQVAIVEFTPNRGAVGEGVRIHGTGFSTTPSENTVTFNGTAATVTSATATELVTSVPPGATSGPIAVTSPGGSDSSSESFMVGSETPSITSISPAVADPGGSVTISGSKFATDPVANSAVLNTTHASVESATATQLVVEVPPIGTSGPFSVATAAGVTTSGDLFVAPPGFTAADVQYTGRMAIGETKTVTISTPQKIGLLLFEGSQGQRVSMKTVESGINPWVTVLNPDGSTFWAASTGSWFDTKTLSQTGTYTITVDPQTDTTGSDTFTLYDVPPDATGTITIGGPAVQVTISTPGQNGSLTFSGTSGQRVSMKTVESGINPWVTVLNPDGSTFWAASTGSWFDTKTLSQTGTYTITVDPQTDTTGSDTFTLYDVPPDATGTITIGGPAVQVTISTPGQNGSLTFSGTSGQQLTLQVAESGINPWVSVKNPSGSTLVNPTTSNSISMTLSQTGTHTIVIDPQFDTTGSATLTLSEPQALAPSFIPLALELADRPRLTAFAAVAPTVSQAGNDADEEWFPDQRNLRGDWTARRPPSRWEALPLLQAADGLTALSGRVLRLNGQPLPGVTLELEGRQTTSDESGRFLLLLEDLPPGGYELEIQGESANRPGRSYGMFAARVEVGSGYTNELPYTIWMPALDTAHTVEISYPITEEIVLTTPRIPGLEVRIPAGSEIRDEEGELVTELGITPIPVDRPPFPLPPDSAVPVYFTVQPGCTYVEPEGARIIYPNYTDEEPGAWVPFWSYDPEEDGWHVYGKGEVTEDAEQVVPDPGVAVYEFAGAMINVPGFNPWDFGPVPGDGSQDGDPVDLGTGLFVYEKTDLLLPDVLPVALTRTYRQADSASRSFGVGTTWAFDLYLWSANQYQEADLFLPDGGKIHYVRISPGTHWTDAVFEHTSSPTAFYKSRIAWNGGGWDLTLRDGTTYVFGDNAPISAIRDRHGNEISIRREGLNIFGSPSGNITALRSPNGRWISFSYDASDRVTEARDNLGRVVTYTYDASGHLWKVTDSAGGVTEYTYDASHQMTALKDPRGITFLQNAYNAQGRVATQTQADSTTYTFSYTTDGNGKITQTEITDPRGNLRRVAFSGGYRTADTRAVGEPEEQAATYERQSGTNLVSAVVDPLGRRTEYAYDPSGNLLSVTRLAGTPQATTTSFTYEAAFSLVASVTDALDHTTTFSYDPSGNLASVTDPTSRQTSFTYRPDGQAASVTDPGGNTTTFTYRFGDLVEITDSLERITARFVDGGGRLAALTDPLGSRTSYAYDALNQVTRVTDPLGGETTFAYDPGGNLLSVTDARDHPTTYGYDALDRLANRTDPLLREESFDYDAGGYLTQVTDRRGKVTQYSYDALARRTFAGFGWDGSAYESTITYSYDDADRLLQAQDSVAGSISLAYDDLDRLISETTPQGQVTYGYDDAGRRTSMTVAGQPQVAYSYDSADRLTGITRENLSATISYDSTGRPATLTLPNQVEIAYAYDAPSQLTGITYEVDAAQVGDLAYAYDAAGRRIQVSGSFARTGLPEAVSSATYDAANQLTTWGGTSLSHDAAGNLTADGASTYAWDARGQLASFTQGITTWMFSYDSFGRRVSRGDGTTTTSYLYDGANPVQELQGGSSVANYLTGLGIDEALARIDSSGTLAYLTDALGSTVALVDGSGSLATTYTYAPFGATTASGTSPNPFQFTGRENDGTGLYYYRARYYNPTFQRFISEDPIGLLGGDPNLYAYVGNSAASAADPSGLYVDTAIDVVFIGYDAYRLATGGRKEFKSNLTALGFDLLGAALPFVAGLGAASRAARLADEAVSNAVPRVIYRAGPPSPSNLRPRPGEEALSFRDSLSNPWVPPAQRPPGWRPVFRPGEQYTPIDVSKLPPDSVVWDNMPPGHVSVRGVDWQTLRDAVVEELRGSFPK